MTGRKQAAASEMVTVPLETLRHLFDLAVDTPLVCSGSFDTDDVNVLRQVAGTIGADVEAITPDEFITQYPHTFRPRLVDDRSRRVGEWLDPVTGRVSSKDPGTAGLRYRVRQETPEETAARVAEERADVSCQAGTHGRRCGLPADDSKHRPTITIVGTAEHMREAAAYLEHQERQGS